MRDFIHLVRLDTFVAHVLQLSFLAPECLERRPFRAYSQSRSSCGVSPSASLGASCTVASARCLTNEVLLSRDSISGEMEAPRVHKDLKMKGKQNTVPENKPQRIWVLPVTVGAGALFAAVSFGIGFAVGYNAVPNAGKY